MGQFFYSRINHPVFYPQLDRSKTMLIGKETSHVVITTPDPALQERILALRGVTTQQDGDQITITGLSTENQKKFVRAARRDARVNPHQTHIAPNFSALA